MSNIIYGAADLLLPWRTVVFLQEHEATEEAWKNYCDIVNA